MKYVQHRMFHVTLTMIKWSCRCYWSRLRSKKNWEENCSKNWSKIKKNKYINFRDHQDSAVDSCWYRLTSNYWDGWETYFWERSQALLQLLSFKCSMAQWNKPVSHSAQDKKLCTFENAGFFKDKHNLESQLNLS